MIIQNQFEHNIYFETEPCGKAANKQKRITTFVCLLYTKRNIIQECEYMHTMFRLLV